MSGKYRYNLVLGITGGIAAYKAAELTRLLQKQNCDIQVVMTQNAGQFVGAHTFSALTGHPVIESMFNSFQDKIEHISLADWAHGVVIAPASANIIGKYSHGIADDFLSTFLLACDKPILLAPAMNPKMYANDAVQENLRILMKRGVHFAGPDQGQVACGHEGIGKMTQPEIISDLLMTIMGKRGDLSGKRVLVTAGPTREKIDPVRFISNRSSGKMGYAIASAAVERGADVYLISGPVNLRCHGGVTLKSVVNAEQMCDEVIREAPNSDIVVMAAAVADWKPEKPRQEKWKKGTRDTEVLSLIKTPDILKELNRVPLKNRVVIGFAAETREFMAEGRRKLQEKNLDAIVVNDVNGTQSGFDTDVNQGFIITRDGRQIDIQLCTKREMADRILDVCLSSFFGQNRSS